MGRKLKVAGLLTVGAMAVALTTVQFQANARSALGPMPLEEIHQFAAVFGLINSDYVEPVDEQNEGDLLVAISGSGNPPHVLKTVEYANQAHARSLAVVGYDSGKSKPIAKSRV